MQDHLGAGSRNILVLDTAMNGCNVGVLRASDKKTFMQSQAMARGQSERLMPMIEEVMGEAALSYQDLHTIITTVGPGAFTGLRIGLSTAKALALALDIEIYGITTLQALALQAADMGAPEKQRVVLVETKREDFYVQVFDAKGGAVSAPAALFPEDIMARFDKEASLFVGDGVKRFRELCRGWGEGLYVFDEALVLTAPAVIAQTFAEGGTVFFMQDVSPVYLKAPDVSMPKKPPVEIKTM